MKTILRKIRKDIRGAALVEFSLILPMLVVFMGFIGEFGRAIYQFHVAETGVKAAARYLARVPVPDVNSCGATLLDAYKVKATNLAQKGTFDATSPFKLSNWQSAGEVTVSVTCIDNAPDGVTNIRPFYGADFVPIITVSASFDFNDVGLLQVVKLLKPSYSDNSGIVISASHKEIYVGD